MPKKIHKYITLKYTIALLLIAILSTSTFYFLNTALKESNNTGEIVNISGKQRMLSQHIALDINKLHTLFNDKEHQYNELALQAFNARVKEMLEANRRLSTGDLSPENSYVLSPTIHNMYFGDMNLSKRVQEYLKIAKSFSTSKTQEQANKSLKEINLLSEPLLQDLNKVVKQYENEGERRLAKMQKMETIAWISTLITLLLEVIFIFQPLVRKINNLYSQNSATLQNLENTVEIRTMYLKEANEKLANLAYHDPLTGLKNRLNLENDIEISIKKCEEHNAPFALLMLDIDWFKKVNDEYGHHVGDVVLQEISAILLESVREEDKVYRAGGEEFVILLNRIEYQDAINTAQKIRLLIEKHIFVIENHEFFKTISIGLYHSSNSQKKSVFSVLKLVDTALYKSKTDGRNRVTIVSEDINAKISENKISKTTIIFEDRTFQKILDITTNENNLISFDTQSLLMANKQFIEYVHPQDQNILLEFPKNATRQKPYVSTIRVDNKGNIAINKITLYNDYNNVILELEESIYISDRVSDKILIQNFQSMLENTDDYIYFKDRNHVFTAASKSLVSLTSAHKREDLTGKIDYDVFDKELADKYFKLERQIFDGKLKIAQELQPTLDKDGNRGVVDNRKYPIHNEKGNIIGLFGIARILSEQK